MYFWFILMTKWKDKYTQEQLDKYKERRRRKYFLLPEEEKKKIRLDCNIRAKNRYKEKKDEIDSYHKEYRERNKKLIQAKDRARRLKIKEQKPILNLIRETKKRATKNNIPFDLKESDVELP